MTIIEAALAHQVAVEAWDVTVGSWRDLAVQLTAVGVTRGQNSNGASESLDVGSGTLELVGDIDLGVDTALRPNGSIRIRHKTSGSVAFTATIIDVNQTFTFSRNKKDRITHTSVVCSDAVQALANTPRYGVVAPGGRQTWSERIIQLNESATVAVTNPPDNENLLYEWPSVWPLDWANGADGWTEQTPGNPANGMQLSAVMRSGAREILTRVQNPSWHPVTGTNLTVAQGVLGIKRTFTGLTIGNTYELTTRMAVWQDPAIEREDARWWRIQVDGKAWSAETRIGQPANGTAQNFPMATLQFVATATSHIIRLTNARQFVLPPSTYSVVEVYVTPGRFSELGIPDEYLLQDVVYESSLLNHYQMACDSVGARFWVDSSNTVQFRRKAEDTGIVATFTDEAGPVEHVGFLEDARNVVQDPATTNAALWPSSNATKAITAGWLRATATATQMNVWANMPDATSYHPAQVGDNVAVRALARAGSAVNRWARLQVTILNASNVSIGTRQGPITALPSTNATVTMQLLGTITEPTAAKVQFSLHLFSSLAGAAPVVNDYLETTQWAAYVGPNVQTTGTVPYFTGATADAGDISYDWLGTVNNSSSVKRSKLYGPASELFYVGIQAGFDTRSVVNAITLNQHGRQLDSEGEPAADDYSVTVTDPDSLMVWGEREGSLETCLWLGFQHELDIQSRAREIFSDRGEPGYQVTQIRWNAAEHLPSAFLLDIGSRILVKFDGGVQRSRIARIRHTLTGTRWMVDLWLTDTVTGPTFDQWSDFATGMTWDQLSDVYDGQTFDQASKRTIN